MTNIAFFEVEKWERDYLAGALKGQQMQFFEDVLNKRMVKKAKDAHILSVFIHSQVTEDVIAEMPDLEMIATRSTGFDHIDLEACNRRGIVVSNVPRYGENTVAEHTFGLILSLSRNIHKAYLRTIAGNFSLEGLQGFDLKGKTLGVIGVGSIGMHVIRIAKGFGMDVLAFDPRPNRLISEVLDFEYVPLEDLLRRSDIVSLHAPYMAQTHHLMNRDRLSMMKHGALLINTARGGLIDTDALIWALDEGILGGAGLDVIEGEELIKEETALLATPAAEDKLRMLLRQHVLLRRENVVVTPHVAFYSREAMHRIVETTVANINAFRDGHPQNVVNAPKPKMPAVA
ncbi:MAG: hydroxyacid dehydrogenase [Chloroflexi bacterium]|nr:hydroxyacid dehydrogenase [Chloroflexota bacterium]